MSKTEAKSEKAVKQLPTEMFSFSEPPPARRGKTAEMIAACKQNPGKWARWHGSPSTGSSLKKQGLEVTIRKLDDSSDEVGLWARAPEKAKK